MFRKLLLTAALFAITATANAQEPQWKLGVVISTLGGGDRGVVVNQVFDGSPASQMGLEAGDVLLTVNGQLAADPQAVRATVFASDSVTLVLKRGNTYYQKDVTFGVAVPLPPDGDLQSNGGGISGGSGPVVPGGGQVVTSAAVRVSGGPKPVAAPAPQKVVKNVQTRKVIAPILPPVKAPTPTVVPSPKPQPYPPVRR